MQNNLTTFNFENNNIRVVNINNEPWFVLTDVCKVLELEQVSRVKSRLEDGVTTNTPIPDSLGRQQNTTLINEDGLYDVILESRKPEAKKIRKWVTSQVLPSIRKTGTYMTDEVIEKTLLNPDFIIKIATQLKEEKNKRKEIEHKLEQANTKLSYYDTILQSKSLVTISQIAKDYGLSGKAMNETLAKLQVQYKQNGQWLLYSNHQNKGYVSSKTIAITRSYGNTDVVMCTEWTQQGRLFLYDLLKKHNILPLIEQNNKLLKQA